MTALFENVQKPGPDDLYCPVDVVLPAARPVCRDAADTRRNTLAAVTAAESDAGRVVPPPTAYDMKHDVEPVLLTMPLATSMNTFPDAGTFTVIDGPTVVRLL